MADRPILFSAPMVQALLAGRKTQTRRVLKNMPSAPAHDSIVHEPKHDAPYFDAYCGGKKTAINPRGMTDRWCWWTRDDRCGHGCKVPYVPGDRMWVKETWGINHYLYCRPQPIPKIRPLDLENHEMVYFATEDDCEINNEMPRTPSIFMPHWASRLTLLVTDVRVERLQDCSEADAIAEGVNELPDTPGWYDVGDQESPLVSKSPVRCYRNLWNSINGPGSWDANPWVVAISFSVHQRNIDKMDGVA